MSKELLENSSSLLLRTNPKLTTNVKVIIDSNDKIYLESMSANEELSKSQYKRFETSGKNEYHYDIFNFYRKGKTPSKIAYDVYKESSRFNIKDSYDKQFEMFYSYGVENLKSIYYDEEFKLFAPIWLERDIPDYFVIFRLDGPVTLNNLFSETENEKASDIYNNENWIKNILSKSKIIKTFDLSVNSEIGKYIRNFRLSERFLEDGFTFQSERNEASYFSGIDFERGGFTSKSEYLYNDIIAKDRSIIDLENFITRGYERNKLIFPYILNLEFLFNDSEVNDFSINRYFGLYVNTVKEGTFRIDSLKMINDINSKQIPKISKIDDFNETTTIDFHQSNKEGIKFYINENTIETVYETGDIDNDGFIDLYPKDFLPRHEDVSKLESIFYIKDKYDNLYNLKTGSKWNNNEELRIANNDINWSNFTGSKDELLKLRGYNFTESGTKSSVFLKINGNIPQADKYFAYMPIKQLYKFKIEDEILTGDIITIKHSTGILTYNVLSTDINFIGRGIKNMWDSSSDSIFNNYYVTVKDGFLIFTERVYTGIDDDFICEVNGNLKPNFIEKIRTSNFEQYIIVADYNIDAEIGKANGFYFNPNGTIKEVAKSMASAFNNIQNRVYDAVAVNDKVILLSKFDGNRFNEIIIGRDLFLEANHIEISSNTNSIYHPEYKMMKFEGGNNNVKSKISVDITSIDILNSDNLYVRIKEEGNSNSTLSKILNVGLYVDEPIYKNGKLLGFKNLDKYCTIYISEEHSIFKDIYNNVYIHELFNIEFGRLSIFPIKDLDFDFYSTEYSKDVEKNIQVDYYKNLLNENSDFRHIDIEDYLGENSFPTLFNIYDNENLDEIKDISIKSEYDRLDENFIKEYSLNSRVIPYINKWVYRNGKNVKDLDYRFNISEAFGITNFSPSIDEYSRNSMFYTHDWLYLQNIPLYYGNYNEFDYANEIINYFPNEIDVTSSGLKNNEFDYFKKYFIVDYLNIPELNTNGTLEKFKKHPIYKQLRYSKFKGGNQFSYATAFHRGVKVIIQERDENITKLDNNIKKIKVLKNNTFNDYKFSAVLIPHIGEYPYGKKRRGIEYEFIENRKFKNITFIVYVNIDDIMTYDNGYSSIDKVVLYSLHSKLKTINSDIPVYDDINLTGALDLIKAENYGVYPSGEIFGIEDDVGDSTNFINEILPNSEGIYNNINYLVGGLSNSMKVEKVLSNSSIIIRDLINPIYPYYLDSEVKVGEFKYVSGGFNFWNSRLDPLSFAEIANKVNLGNKNIKYITVMPDNSIEENKFLVKFETANTILKPSYLKTSRIKDKPVTFNLEKTIGYELSLSETGSTQLLHIHIGNYIPKLLDIVKFEDPYIIENNENFKDIKTQIHYYMKHKNTRLKIDNSSFIIKNYFFHKINDKNPDGILELTKSEKYKSEYPFINEVAIDKKDLYLWPSNWDANYFRNYTDKSNFENIVGTRSMLEKKSFLGSKVIKIRENLILEDFIQLKLSNIEELDLFKNEYSKHTNDVNLTWCETESQFIIDIYLEKRIIDSIIEFGFMNYISKYIKPEFSFGNQNSIEDDAIEYIKLNILKLYNIDKIDLFVKKDRNLKDESLIVTDIKNSVKIQRNMSNTNEFNVQALSSNNSLNIRLIYNKSKGYRYEISPTVKISRK